MARLLKIIIMTITGVVVIIRLFMKDFGPTIRISVGIEATGFSPSFAAFEIYLFYSCFQVSLLRDLFLSASAVVKVRSFVAQ